MIEGIAIGFGAGIACMTGIAGLGILHLKKHPEIIAKEVGKRMSAAMRKQRVQQSPSIEKIP